MKAGRPAALPNPQDAVRQGQRSAPVGAAGDRALARELAGRQVAAEARVAPKPMGLSDLLRLRMKAVKGLTV